MGKFKLSDLQEDPPPLQFPHLMGYLDIPMRKTLRVVGLVTVMIFFQGKKIYFLMVFNLLKIIHPFESKKTFKDLVKLNCNTQEYLVCY